MKRKFLSWNSQLLPVHAIWKSKWKLPQTGRRPFHDPFLWQVSEYWTPSRDRQFPMHSYCTVSPSRKDGLFCQLIELSVKDVPVVLPGNGQRATPLTVDQRNANERIVIKRSILCSPKTKKMTQIDQRLLFGVDEDWAIWLGRGGICMYLIRNSFGSKGSTCLNMKACPHLMVELLHAIVFISSPIRIQRLVTIAMFRTVWLKLVHSVSLKCLVWVEFCWWRVTGHRSC